MNSRSFRPRGYLYNSDSTRPVYRGGYGRAQRPTYNYNAESTHQSPEDNVTEQEANFIMRHRLKGCTLTISNTRSPDYYLKLIMYFFKTYKEDLIYLQALGLSCENLMNVSV